MPKIDRLVIDQGAALAASGRFVHMNLSATTIDDFTVFGDILTVVHVRRAEPARMTFEVTETAAVASMQNATRLADRLRAFGFHVSLKIDRVFLRDLGVNPRAARLVRAAVALAGELGVTTVAEGVEDERSLTAARALGVDYASRPLDVDPEHRRFARFL